jgi:hypothetical protein
MQMTNIKKRNIFTTIIDYSKAFDSVPHFWIIQVLKIYKISPVTVQFRTEMFLYSSNQEIRTGIINIALCLALKPLSNLLNKSNLGFKINKPNEEEFKINRLIYMYDIKLYSSSASHMKTLIEKM